MERDGREAVIKEKIMKPQFICLTCKTVIGPVWDRGLQSYSHHYFR